MSELPKRSSRFSRNDSLEDLLVQLNALLAPGNEELLAHSEERFSKIFIVGSLRSGTTLFTQWLASTGLAAYPTNLLSRFYGAPLVGAKIQLLLTDPRYNFRNEILDFDSEIDFASENGKTKGARAPNEFWYFWRRFLPFKELDYMPDEQLRSQGDLTGLRDELNALGNIFGRPFALKAMIMNQNIPVLDSLFGKALFVWIKRDPVFNIQSALEARKRQYDDLDTWYSFRIKEYPYLKTLPPLESVAGQVHSINRSIEAGLGTVAEHKKIIVQYEDFCRHPAGYHTKLVELLRAQDGVPVGEHEYHGVAEFSNTNTWRLAEYSQQEVEAAYREASRE